MFSELFDVETPSLAELAELCEQPARTVYDLAYYADRLKQAGQIDEAIETYLKTISLCESTAVDVRFRLDLLVSMGRLLTQSHQYVEARQQLTAAAELSDLCPEDGMRRYSVFDALASFHSATGDHKQESHCRTVASDASLSAVTAAIEKRRRSPIPFDRMVIAKQADREALVKSEADRALPIVSARVSEATSKQRTPKQKSIAKRVSAKRVEWERQVHSMFNNSLSLPTNDQIHCISALTDCGALSSAKPVPIRDILDALRKQGSWTPFRLRDICERAKLDGFVSSRSSRDSQTKTKGVRSSTKAVGLRRKNTDEGAEETTYALTAPAMEILARVAAGLNGGKGLRQDDRLCFQQLVASLKIDPATEEAIRLWMSDLPPE